MELGGFEPPTSWVRFKVLNFHIAIEPADLQDFHEGVVGLFASSISGDARELAAILATPAKKWLRRASCGSSSGS
jgi:hypothetical protein